MRVVTRLLPLVILLSLAVGPVGPAHAEDDDPPVSEAVRKAQIKKLGRRLRKTAQSPRAASHKDEIVALLESLEVLGGWEAGNAALYAVALDDVEVRDQAFGLVETEHHAKLVKPLAEMLEAKRYRRDEDVRERAARSLSIMGDASAMPPLTELIRTDEHAKVVAAAADSLAAYSGGPLALRKEAVKRLVNVYTATWNLMMSVRPEDKVIGAVMKKKWKVYGRSVRSALQALTGEQTLTRPQEWREWWNDNKKRTDW